MRVCSSRWDGGAVRVEEEHCARPDLDGLCLPSVDCGKHHKAKAVIDMNNKSASWQRDVSQAADWGKATWQRERPGVSPWCCAALLKLLCFDFPFFTGWGFCLFEFRIFKMWSVSSLKCNLKTKCAAWIANFKWLRGIQTEIWVGGVSWLFYWKVHLVKTQGIFGINSEFCHSKERSGFFLTVCLMQFLKSAQCDVTMGHYKNK